MYLDYNWKKEGGSARMIEISKREQFYQQEYCGCVYSLRDTNQHRRNTGRNSIRIWIQYYGQDENIVEWLSGKYNLDLMDRRK